MQQESQTPLSQKSNSEPDKEALSGFISAFRFKGGIQMLFEMSENEDAL